MLHTACMHRYLHSLMGWLFLVDIEQVISCLLHSFHHHYNTKNCCVVCLRFTFERNQTCERIRLAYNSKNICILLLSLYTWYIFINHIGTQTYIDMNRCTIHNSTPIFFSRHQNFHIGNNIISAQLTVGDRYVPWNIH